MRILDKLKNWTALPELGLDLDIIEEVFARRGVSNTPLLSFNRVSHFCSSPLCAVGYSALEVLRPL